MLTQWFVKYGHVPIVLIGIAGLAVGIGTREWKSDATIVAESPVVAEAPVVREPPTEAAEAQTFVKRRPPTLETEPKPSIELAALDADTRLLDESDQPASKVRHIEPARKAGGARDQDSPSQGWMGDRGIEPRVERETGRHARDRAVAADPRTAELPAVAPAAHSFGRRGR